LSIRKVISCIGIPIWSLCHNAKLELKHKAIKFLLIATHNDLQIVINIIIVNEC